MRFALPVALFLSVLFVEQATKAAPIARKGSLTKTASEGLALAKSGDCVAAVAVLEQAEAEEHRPVTAYALADCHVALGEILLAHEIFSALAKEDPKGAKSTDDKKALERAAAAASELDGRIPRLTIVLSPRVENPEFRVAGRKADVVDGKVLMPPDEKVDVEVRASGYQPATTSILLHEGETKSIQITLTPVGGTTDPNNSQNGNGQPKPEAAAPDPLPKHWFGVRFRGLVIPQFAMNLVGEGGTTTYWPGAAITYSNRSDIVDVEPSILFTSYGLSTTPFKPHDTPDTEWELIESDLWGVTAIVDILYRIKLDADSKVELRIGGGFGIGWAFTGDLYRWQSYPEDGQPGDPSTYQKCNGPNDPAGTFRYCNQLDKDKERFGNPDFNWFQGGARPVVYPWLSLPQISLAIRPIPELAIDIEFGLTLNGFLTGLGLRYGPNL